MVRDFRLESFYPASNEDPAERALDMADHEHGKMDITEHEKTFEGFIKFWIWLFGVSAGILIFLAIFNS